jgi:APA family basic amino acid/polyamine antiporter
MLGAPGTGPGHRVDLFAAILCVLIAFLLNRNIKASARMETILGAVKVAIVIVAIIVGAFYLKPANLSPYFPDGFGGAVSGAATVFFAVFGCDAMSTAAEESKDAQRNLPKANIHSLAISMVLYLLACTVLTGIQHYDRIDKKCGFATAFKSIGLDRFADVVAIGAIVGILTVLFSFMLGASRIWYAISRDGLLPSWFAQTNRSHVPHRPTWIVGVLSAAIAGMVPIGTAAELTNIGILVAFIVVSAAVIVLCYRSPELDRTFRTPAMPLTPILGTGFSVWLISKLPAATWWRSSSGSCLASSSTASTVTDRVGWPGGEVITNAEQLE